MCASFPVVSVFWCLSRRTKSLVVVVAVVAAAAVVILPVHLCESSCQCSSSSRQTENANANMQPIYQSLSCTFTLSLSLQSISCCTINELQVNIDGRYLTGESASQSASGSANNQLSRLLSATVLVIITAVVVVVVCVVPDCIQAQKSQKEAAGKREDGKDQLRDLKIIFWGDRQSQRRQQQQQSSSSSLNTFFSFSLFSFTHTSMSKMFIFWHELTAISFNSFVCAKAPIHRLPVSKSKSTELVCVCVNLLCKFARRHTVLCKLLICNKKCAIFLWRDCCRDHTDTTTTVSD